MSGAAGADRFPGSTVRASRTLGQTTKTGNRRSVLGAKDGECSTGWDEEGALRRNVNSGAQSTPASVATSGSAKGKGKGKGSKGSKGMRSKGMGIGSKGMGSKGKGKGKGAIRL
jgi:hypothetical protein